MQDQGGSVQLFSAEKKRAFQTIAKHTRYTQVDCATHADSLQCLFGGNVDCAFSAYRPKFERIPPEAARTALYRAVVTLGPDGTLSQTGWEERPASKQRRPFASTGTCLFAFARHPPGEVSQTAPAGQKPASASSLRPPKPYAQDPNSLRNPKPLTVTFADPSPNSPGPKNTTPPQDPTLKLPASGEPSDGPPDLGLSGKLGGDL